MTLARYVPHAAWIALVIAANVPAACSRDVLVGENNIALGSARGSGAAGPGGGADAPSGCRRTSCQNHVYQCGNCFDDDGDGLVDMDDPDCLGPCQNSEDSFSGIPGQNNQECTQDCYFDQDSGSGNDDCIWSHKCDPLSVAPDYPPEGASCAYDPNATVPRQGRAGDCATLRTTQSAQCLNVCGPLTPNGCDCFGCCTVSGSGPFWLGSVFAQGSPSCDIDHIADPTRCKPCTQVTACLNPCEDCELCVGKRVLPASCSSGGCVTPSCPAGLTPCGTPCLPGCPSGQACITGCCVTAPH